ncbi:MAG TPA: hypothetical protein VGQ83_15440 [Polyangia bacterium]|jgi:hypothetical protein
MIAAVTLLAFTLAGGPPAPVAEGARVRLEEASFGAGVVAVAAGTARLALSPGAVPTMVGQVRAGRGLALPVPPLVAVRLPALAPALAATPAATLAVAAARDVPGGEAGGGAARPRVAEGVWRPG